MANLNPKRITELPQIGYGEIKEDDFLPLDSDTYGTRRINALSISYTIPVKMLGIRADGSSDETIKLRNILNTRDNVTYIFPHNATILTSEPIDVVASGIKIIGNNCTIKQKANSGALIRMSNREFCNLHQTGWISFFGDDNVIDGLNIDINWHQNKYSDSHGEWGYFPPRGTKHPTKAAAGFDGIVIVGYNNLVTNCKIYNPTWNGIAAPNYDYSRNANAKDFFHTGNVISFNEVYNATQDGICIIGQDDCSVIHNKIQMNRFHGIHAYLKCKNCRINYNEFFCDDSVDNTLAFPNEDLATSEGCIMVGHSLYPDYQVTDTEVKYNTIVNRHSTKQIRQGIMIQNVSHSKNIRIAHNFIKDIKVNAIQLDVYSYGDIIIEDNTIIGANKGIAMVLGLISAEFDCFPTFTSDLPKSNIYIYNNRFDKIDSSNYTYSGDAYTVKEKHEAHIDQCNIYIDENTNFGDGIIKNTSANKDNFDKTIYTRVNTFTKDQLPTKTKLTFYGASTGSATAVTGEENNNYYIVNNKVVEVNAIFNFKTHKTAQPAFYVKTPMDNAKITIPVVYYPTSDTSKAIKPGLLTIMDNKAQFSVGGSETAEDCVVMAHFTYHMM